jgi:ribosomal protein S18 acetylase RimI-like enzyme
MESDDVQIVGYDERYAKDFARLNYEWIEKYFRVEEHDREMLDAPFEYVIKPGGQILFGLVSDAVAGTVALLAAGENTFELAKMAVSPAFQGLGISNKLMQACIEYARSVGKKRIFLESNTKLTPAISLYRKFGFKEVPMAANSPYERVNIRMELAIEAADM